MFTYTLSSLQSSSSGDMARCPGQPQALGCHVTSMPGMPPSTNRQALSKSLTKEQQPTKFLGKKKTTAVTISLFVKHNDLKCKEIQTSLPNTGGSISCYHSRWPCPALHMHTPHMYTQTSRHSVTLQGTTALSVGEAQGLFSVSWSLLGGKLLVKYTSIFYFNQPTTCSTFPNYPPPRSVCPIVPSLHH